MKKKSKVSSATKKTRKAEEEKYVLIGTAKDVPAFILKNYGIDILKPKKPNSNH